MQWITKTLGVNKAEQMYAELNSRHFEQGQKLNDKAMLTAVAANVGADPAEAERFLDSEQGLAEIQAAQRQLRELGVSGIPTLILGGKYKMPSGAIGSDMLVSAFRAIEEEGGANHPSKPNPLEHARSLVPAAASGGTPLSSGDGGAKAVAPVMVFHDIPQSKGGTPKPCMMQHTSCRARHPAHTGSPLRAAQSSCPRHQSETA